MKETLSSIILVGSLITNRPNKQKVLNQHVIENKLQQDKSIGIKTKSYKGKPMKVNATAYYGDTITSTGTVPKVGQTIAVDPKVIPYGTKVYIPELGKVFIAEDCGSAIKGNKIDIFMGSYNECMDWGVRAITIYIIE